MPKRFQSRIIPGDLVLPTNTQSAWDSKDMRSNQISVKRAGIHAEANCAPDAH